MKIAVLGTGIVGETIGSKLAALGHDVMIGSRTKNNEKALEFVNKNSGQTSSGTFAEATVFGEIVFNCTKGEHSLDALQLAGTGLKGKILVDLANPLDFSQGMPPTLIPSLSNSTSLGEEIQKAYPEAKVVKTLNTMWNGLMVNPTLIGNGDHINYISGNDAEAKSKVMALLVEMGWKKENILDLGDISAARGTEGYLPLWLRIYGATGSNAFNFKLVK
ncbi:coenzyme F420-dependent NADP reductase [Flavobacterium enshiense DK69]|uniref:NADP oxidoreductase n=1 Tax=Flavobacterium enshiense DK69 TaxID=1107311 RepID=V6SAP2_9FLAO|nr:NAD(P)-binding domain-containing protein [Flavobacterium enshiense]ESU23728.1 coenzyme F420-dependent NADP reductase [Flavobacterium enshiense DK69]KGO96143.1 NADP oxidoreductase [Flavobacterium enshiense DK69]